MGLFTKVSLDDDFEQALYGNGARAWRKEISKSQAIIRSNLGPDERLMFIFCGEFIWKWTLVFTNSRLLIFKSSTGFNQRVESLAYSCQPQDILQVAAGPTSSRGGYGAVLVIRQTKEKILVKTSYQQDAELIGNIAAALRDDRRL
jgi:hypothetical protein